MLHLVHSYGVSMPSRVHRLVMMSALAVVASVLASMLALFNGARLTISIQFLAIATLAAWAAIGSLWFP